MNPKTMNESDGSLTLINNIISDVVQKRLQKELNELQAKLQPLLEPLPLGLPVSNIITQIDTYDPAGGRLPRDDYKTGLATSDILRYVRHCVTEKRLPEIERDVQREIQKRLEILPHE